MTSPPNLLDHLSAAWKILSRQPAGLLTDVDGTLSPIVDQPEMAGVHPEVPALLRRLVARLPLVAAVSGRPVSQLPEMVGVEGVVYVGNHGLEWWQGGRATVVPEAEPFLPAVAETMDHVRGQLELPGVILEGKGATGTIHYRLAQDTRRAREAILQLLVQCPSARGLQISEGRRVVNILPPIETSKGTAVQKLARDRGLSGAIYMGDDVTDMDAFQALSSLRRAGSCDSLLVAVSSPEVPADLLQEADYQLEGVDAVVSFLEQAAAFLEMSGD